MTEKTQPTDAELDMLIDEVAGLDSSDEVFREFARAVLAKWGTPPAVAGEPVATLHCNQDCYVWARATEAGKRLRFEEPMNLYTTPQPTQAQAGAVPLTCEWAHNEDDGFWDTECGQSWRFDDGGPKENHMNFCHCCGKPLRIKGGQHGAE